MTLLVSIEKAVADLRAGKFLILIDDDNREQEGDLIIAADKITPEAINFMTQKARGLICLALAEEIIDHLGIPLMPQRHAHKNQAAFTVSIEAVRNITTGVSAADRCETIRVAIDPRTNASDIGMPGHIFPLKARQGGVIVRAGHTEGSVDLMKLAGLRGGAVICEIMKSDGRMARLPDLQKFAAQHDIHIASINELIAYRFRHENYVEPIASAPLPIKCDTRFSIKAFRNRLDLSEHFALVHDDFDPSKPTTVRIHSECLTGDVFGSQRCDCGEQLNQALKILSAEKGILLYLPQEGRGIGLTNKIKAYELQSQGLDTVEANHQLGFKADQRYYGMSAQILKYLGVHEIRLLTNNPRKLQDLQQFGIQIIERIALEINASKINQHYLKTKRDKLGHLLEKIEG